MVNITYRLGPSRPNKPNQKIMSIIERAVKEVLGNEATVVVTSGREDDGQQYGSDRHKTGDAADVAIYDGKNRRILASDPEAYQLAVAAARNGAKGIGWGTGYMNGRNFHFDAVDPKEGQAHTWGDEGVRYRDEITKIIRQTTANGNNKSQAKDETFEDPFATVYNPIVNATSDITKYDVSKTYTLSDIDRDFFAIYDILEAAKRSTPRLIEIENLLLK